MPLDQKTIQTAVKEAKEKSEKRKFTQSVELVLSLKDIDMKSAEGRIQEIVELPHVPAKPNRVCVIATGELALKARKADVDLVIEKADLEGLAGKKRELRKIAVDHDFFIAEAPLMPLVGKILGSVLGPRGKMPVPVPPTADMNVLLAKHRKTVVLKVRNQPMMQCRVGTEDMKEEELTENILTVLRAMEGKLKKGMKNIRFASIKTAMGAPVRVKP